MIIKPYSKLYAKEVTLLFHKSVHTIEPSIYSDIQKEAWAPTPPHFEKWAKRLERKKPYLAFKGDVLVGFMELEMDGHIDCAYVHPEYQGQGIGTLLLNHILEKAMGLKLSRLYVEASIVAKPFFEKHGFAVICENKVERSGIQLNNYKMELIAKFTP